MSVLWLQPLMWAGAALLLLPVVIHLLTRARTRHLPFPSLRFVPATRLAALRSRAITDWALLAMRVSILAAAVAAAAAPVFVSDARRDAWDDRVARAIVLAGPDAGGVRSIVADLASESFTLAEFHAERVPDAVIEAAAWLRRQPPARREVVIVGDLREGALAAAHLETLPPFVGIRFLPVVAAGTEPRAAWHTVGETADGELAMFTVRVAPDEARTRASYDRTTSAPWPVRLVAPAVEQRHADAVLRAVLRAGIVSYDGTPATRDITLAFAGAAVPELPRAAPPSRDWMRETLVENPAVRGGEVEGRLVLQASVAVTDADAPRIVADVLRAAFGEPPVDLEPRRISAARLAAWSRPAGPSPRDALPADEGDRRWLWGLALALLALEQVVRRQPHAA